MSMYLRKKSIKIADQSDEIMGKLMGRAKDVVKIGIHSDPSLVLSSNLIQSMLP